MAGMVANLRWSPGSRLAYSSAQVLHKEYLQNVICDPIVHSPLTSPRRSVL